MLVLLYAVELEILESLDAKAPPSLPREAAQAYRDRARLLQITGRPDAARADSRHADRLEAEAAKLAAKPDGKENDASLRDLIQQVEKLQNDLTRTLVELQREPAGRRQVNASPATGRIELINQWTGSVTIVLDGVSHDLRAGQSLTLSRAAGDFTYEVRGIRVPTTRRLAVGEIFAIRVGPR